MEKAPFIIAVTTFAEDHVIYSESGRREVAAGGPGRWIGEAYRRLGAPHRFVTSGQTVRVEVELVNGEPPPGRIYCQGSRVTLPRGIRADGFLVNTLDDFDLQEIEELEGTVLVDIANYTRGGPYKQERRPVPMPPPAVRRRIEIVKANHEELPWMPGEWVAEQKRERILIHTLGKEGLDLWVRGETRHIAAPAGRPKNLLGAGDTLGAAFLFFYIGNGKDAPLAAQQATFEVGRLLAAKADQAQAM